MWQVDSSKHLKVKIALAGILLRAVLDFIAICQGLGFLTDSNPKGFRVNSIDVKHVDELSIYAMADMVKGRPVQNHMKKKTSPQEMLALKLLHHR